MSAVARDAPEEKRSERRRSPRRRLRFTREGRVFILVTLGVGVAAVNTGNNLLYLVLGLMLSLIVLSGVLSELALRRLHVTRRLPRRAFAGSPCVIELEVENGKKRSSSYSIELRDMAPSEPTDARAYLLKLPPRSSRVVSYRRTPARRGPLSLTEVVAQTRYPFGLFEKSRSAPVAGELLVYPALDREGAPTPVTAEAGQAAPSRRRGWGTEWAGLRDYRDGDEARSIHWRRTATIGRVVVRERQNEAARRLTLVVDEGRPADAHADWDAGFERMLSRAAATAAHALEEGVAVDVVSRWGSSPLVPPGSAPDPIWRFLALLRPRPLTPGEPELETPPGKARRFEVDASEEAR